jgi:hypothetical protein
VLEQRTLVGFWSKGGGRYLTPGRESKIIRLTGDSIQVKE